MMHKLTPERQPAISNKAVLLHPRAPKKRKPTQPRSQQLSEIATSNKAATLQNSHSGLDPVVALYIRGSIGRATGELTSPIMQSAYRIKCNDISKSQANRILVKLYVHSFLWGENKIYEHKGAKKWLFIVLLRLCGASV